MPVVARIGSIVIRMYFLQSEHNPPHVHALYGGFAAAIDIRSLDVLDGELPPKELALVCDWVTTHRTELLSMWETQDFRRLT